MDTHSRILEAAADMFAERGFRGSTMRDIAGAARINEVTIYRYFPAKQNLYWQAVDWKMRSLRLSECLIGSLSRNGRPREVLELFYETAFDIFSEEPKLARLISFSELELDRWDRRAIYTTHVKPVIEALVIRLRSWLANGEIRLINPEVAASVILGLLLGQLQLRRMIIASFCDKPVELVSSECARICLHGIGTDGSKP